MTDYPQTSMVAPNMSFKPNSSYNSKSQTEQPSENPRATI